jgi:PAS domain S-box-containing protein
MKKMDYTLDELKTILENIPGYVVFYSVRENRIIPIIYSKNAPSFSGLTEAEYLALYGQDTTPVVAERDLPMLQKAIADVLNGHERDATYRTYHKTKGFVWTFVHLKPIGTYEGYPVMAGVFFNVTDEVATHESLLNNIDQKIYVVERGTYDLLYANDKAIADKKSAPMIGQNCYKYISNADSPCRNCIINKIEGSQPFQTERYDEAKKRTFEIKAVPMSFFGKDACAFFFYDMTHHAALEKKLKEEHQKYLSATEGANLRVYEYDIQKHTIDLPKYAAGLFGVAPHIENVPDSIRDLFNEEDHERMEQFFKKVDEGVPKLSDEFHMKEVNGVAPWLRCTFTTSFDDDGRPLKAFAIAEDITKEKESEQRLKEERMHLNALGGNVILAFTYNVTKNSEASFTFAKGYENFLESQKDNPLIKNMDQSLHVPEEQKKDAYRIMMLVASSICDEKDRRLFIDTTKRANLMQAFSEGRKSQKIEYRMWANGEVIWVVSVVNLLQDPYTGDLIVFIYNYDINEQKMFRDILTGIMSVSYEIISYYSKHTRRIYVHNNKTTQAGQPDFRSLPYDETIDMLADKLLTEEDRDEFRQKYKTEKVLENIAQDRVYTDYLRLSERSAKIPTHPHRILKHTMFYLDDNEDIIGSLFEDVTEAFEEERKNREKLATALKSAETANAAKSDFLSRMSHDIRTPLNGILGMTTIAKAVNKDPETDNCLNKIDSSGHFLLGLVNDILDVNKIESGKMKLYPEPYAFAEFSEYLSSIIEPLCADKNIKFVVDADEVQSQIILADKLRVSQIFINLLSNAVKFTPKGGTVWFEIRNGGVVGDSVRTNFVVRDNGIGMSEEFQKKLFDPFEQESAQIDYSRNGSGLGLSIVKKLVEMMGGTISVKSAPGQGSEFNVSLVMPMSNADSSQVTSYADIPAAELAGKHVLVAEDNEINQEIILKLLEMKDMHATVVSNGEEALKRFEASRPYWYDIILMDIRMPVMDGLMAAKKIRALDRPDAETVPIVAMTANAFDDDVKECLAAGMDMHLAKPIDTGHMFKIIGKLIRSGHKKI